MKPCSEGDGGVIRAGGAGGGETGDGRDRRLSRHSFFPIELVLRNPSYKAIREVCLPFTGLVGC